MEFFFSIELVSLVESCIVVSHMFPYFLIKVVPDRGNQDDGPSY